MRRCPPATPAHDARPLCDGAARSLELRALRELAAGGVQKELRRQVRGVCAVHDSVLKVSWLQGLGACASTPSSSPNKVWWMREDGEKRKRERAGWGPPWGGGGVLECWSGLARITWAVATTKSAYRRTMVYTPSRPSTAQSSVVPAVTATRPPRDRRVTCARVITARSHEKLPGDGHVTVHGCKLGSG